MRASRTSGLAALTLAVSGLGLAVSVDVAAAGDQACLGEPATIVGEPGSTVNGTDGPDVIVTNGATETYAGTGDDLVCVTGGSRTEDVDVSAGDGDDVVDTTASTALRAQVRLDDGDDSFTGGPGPDHVSASDPWESPRGQGADLVNTGDGDDLVETGGGSFTSPDHDVIDLGRGRDSVWLQGAVDPQLPLDGGPGSDELEFGRGTMRQALVIDNAAGHATAAGEPVTTWSGFERFRFAPMGVVKPPSFVGGAGPDRVWTAVPLTSVDLGGGDDLLDLELQDKLVDHASYVGGRGHDAFILYAGAGDQARRVEIDLPHRTLLFRRDEQAVRALLRGFETHRMFAVRLDFYGTAAPDHVQWLGCRGVIRTRGGDDLVEELSDGDAGCGSGGSTAQLVVRGGPGADRLIGNDYPDTLFGGPGKDRAEGRGGQDRCVAEVRIRCEL